MNIRSMPLLLAAGDLLYYFCDVQNSEAMNRYFIELSYKGTRYHGWQQQPNAESVQALIDNALTTLVHEPVETTGAGRTDAGVHALFLQHILIHRSTLTIAKILYTK